MPANYDNQATDPLVRFLRGAAAISDDPPVREWLSRLAASPEAASGGDRTAPAPTQEGRR